MAIEKTLTTLIRSTILPGMENVWCDQSWYLGRRFKENWISNDGTSFDVVIVHEDPSNTQMLGPLDIMNIAQKEWASKGNELPRMKVSPGVLTHDQLLSMNNKEAIANIMKSLTEENAMGFEKKFAEDLLSRSAAAYSRTATSRINAGYRWINLNDVFTQTTSTALHNLQPNDSDFSSTSRWLSQYIDGTSICADEDALLNPNGPGFLPRIIKRIIAKCAKWGRKADMAVILSDYHFAILGHIADAHRRIQNVEKNANFGFSGFLIDDVPCVADGYYAGAQTSNADGVIDCINFKQLNYVFNGKQAFTTDGVQTVPGAKYKIFDIATYGNLVCKNRRAHGRIANVYSDKTYA